MSATIAACLGLGLVSAPTHAAAPADAIATSPVLARIVPRAAERGADSLDPADHDFSCSGRMIGRASRESDGATVVRYRATCEGDEGARAGCTVVRVITDDATRSVARCVVAVDDMVAVGVARAVRNA